MASLSKCSFKLIVLPFYKRKDLYVSSYQSIMCWMDVLLGDLATVI